MAKYKLKTHKGTAKRFHITATGKILRIKAHKSHLRRKKPGRVRRLYDEKISMSPTDVKRVKRLLPHGAK